MYFDPNNQTPLGPKQVWSDTWPEPHWTAKPGSRGAAVIAYMEKFKQHPGFPASAFSVRHGDFHLPDLDQPQAETDDVPRYRFKTTGFKNGAMYPAGMEFDFPHWPPRDQMWNFEPVNESAKRVHRFRTRFHNVTAMPGQPYDAALKQLVLPKEFFGKPEPFSHRGSFGGISIGA